MKSKIEQNSTSGTYRKVRAILALNGTSLACWCQERGITRQWAVAVLKGERSGPAAEALKSRILSELGIRNG